MTSNPRQLKTPTDISVPVPTGKTKQVIPNNKVTILSVTSLRNKAGNYFQIFDFFSVHQTQNLWLDRYADCNGTQCHKQTLTDCFNHLFKQN